MLIVRNALLIAPWLILGLGGTVSSKAADRVRYDNHTLVNVTLTSQDDVETMLTISQDHWTDNVGIGTIPFRVPPDGMAALADSGLDFSIVHENIQQLIDRQRAGRQAEPAGWFDDFKTYGEVNAYIDTLVALRPDLVSKFELGQSLEGRMIYGMGITAVTEVANAPAVLFNGTQHAREWISPMVCMYIADMLVQTYDTDSEVRALMNEVVFYIVPIVNPDGYVYAWDVERMWRKNRRDNGGSCFGVDNNRNWGFHWGDDASSSSDPCSLVFRGAGPFSEPENQVLRDFILAHPRILAHMDVHSYGQDLFSPYGEVDGEPPEPDRTTFRTLNAEMSAAIFAVHGMVYDARPSDGYLSGGCAVWTYNDRGILSWSLELRDDGTYGFLLPADQIVPTCEENFEAVKDLAEYIAMPFTFSFPDGLPARVTTNTETTVSLEITEVSGTLDPATAQVFTRTGTSGTFTSSSLTPLGGEAFEAVLPAAPCGSVIQYYFQAVSTTGSVRTSPAEAPGVLYEAEAIDTLMRLSADMESDAGWSVGALDDDATTGVWVRVDPNGTEAQPENDHTPAGSQSWVTGQGSLGGALGENDVDGGKTTLFSPVLDLTDLDLIIGYWRWYSNDTGMAPNADVLVVDISSDGGGEWFNVETIGPAGVGTSGGWMYHEFRVTDMVEPTADVVLRFVASDFDDGSLVEAAIDDFTVRLAECGPQSLSVTAEGCRYIAITPPNESDPVALHLSSPQHPCLSKYVTANGTIADEPVLRSPLDWGIILTRGAGIVPNTEYVVQPEDEFGAFVGPASSATTYEWGDIAGTFLDGAWTPPNGVVDFRDISATVDRFRSAPTSPSLESCDIAPETPNSVVDFEDISYVVDAFRSLPYPFELPCP